MEGKRSRGKDLHRQAREMVYSETSIHRFHWGSEKETMDLGKR
jgi:hypothetical protein